MSDSPFVLVRTGGKPWGPPDVTSYAREVELQAILVAQPTLIPVVAEGAAAVAELQSRAGRTDICIVDSGGNITLVECKLATNDEIRRKIVGQVLDYASLLWRMSFDEFDRRWRDKHSGRLGVVESLNLGDADAEAEVRDIVAANLQNGRFSLVLVADVINDDLRRIVAFLNDRTRSELAVIALELRYAKHGDFEVMVPTVFGAELARHIQQDSKRWWLVSEVYEYLEAQNDPALAALRTFTDGVAELTGVRWEGTAGSTPSMTLRFECDEGTAWPLAVYTSRRTMQINFGYLRPVPEERRRAFTEAMGRVPGAGIDAETVIDSGYAKRPHILLDLLLDPVAASALAEAIAALVVS